MLENDSALLRQRGLGAASALIEQLRRELGDADPLPRIEITLVLSSSEPARRTPAGRHR